MSELQAIKDSFFDSSDGQERLQRWFGQRASGPEATRAATLAELCTCFDAQSHQLRALFALYGGALVEGGVDASPLARAMLGPLTEALTSARRMVRRARELRAAAAGEEDEELTEGGHEVWLDASPLPGALVAQLKAEDRDAFDGFLSLGLWFRPFVAAFSRVPALLPEARRHEALVALVDELHTADQSVHWMYTLLHALGGETVVVLVPESGEGFRVAVSGCIDMGQFTTLLSDPLDAAFRKVGAKGRASQDMLDVARGLGPQQGEGVYGSNVHFFPWQAMDPVTGLPVSDRVEWRAPGGTGTGSLPADFLVADAPVLDGERVLLLVGPRAPGIPGFVRILSSGRAFESLPAALHVTPLTADETRRWLARVREAASPHAVN